MRPWIIRIVVVALVASACALEVEGDGDADVGPATTSPVTLSPVTTSSDTSPVTTSPVTTSPVELDLPAPIEGYETTEIEIGERVLTVAIADTSAKRSQGLMFITDLRGIDGMLFVWNRDREGTFWMKNTLIPLDIAWFDSAGAYVGKLTMEPCDLGDDCPKFSPGAAYQFAVETAEGDLDFVSPATRLLVDRL